MERTGPDRHLHFSAVALGTEIPEGYEAGSEGLLDLRARQINNVIYDELFHQGLELEFTSTSDDDGEPALISASLQPEPASLKSITLRQDFKNYRLAYNLSLESRPNRTFSIFDRVYGNQLLLAYQARMDGSHLEEMINLAQIVFSRSPTFQNP
ncbi:MAG TPA: hypothetical protein VGA08_02730 [Candidatus Saccharimonadales bacterium]